MEVVSALNRKLLLWLEKHFIHSKFKPDDVFSTPFYINFLGYEKKLES
jgi:hypothetical protein